MLTLCSQRRCFDSIRVDVTAADCAVHVTALFAIPTANLTLAEGFSSSPNTSSSSKDDLSILCAWGFDWRISWYAHIVPFIADVVISSGTLGRFGSESYR